MKKTILALTVFSTITLATTAQNTSTGIQSQTIMRQDTSRKVVPANNIDVIRNNQHTTMPDSLNKPNPTLNNSDNTNKMK